MKANLKNLQMAHQKVAALLLHDEAYLPIFLRLERELADLKQKDDALSRARAAVERYRAVG